jgi:hypothetical protein
VFATSKARLPYQVFETDAGTESIDVGSVRMIRRFRFDIPSQFREFSGDLQSARRSRRGR